MWDLDHKEGWAWKNWCLWTVVLEKTLESALDSKMKSLNSKRNQSWIFIGRADTEAKTQYFGHLMWRTDSLEKTLMLGEIEGRSRRGRQRLKWLYDITNSMDMGLSKLWDMLKGREAWCAAVHGVTKSQSWPSDWTTTDKSQGIDKSTVDSTVQYDSRPHKKIMAKWSGAIMESADEYGRESYQVTWSDGMRFQASSF